MLTGGAGLAHSPDLTMRFWQLRVSVSSPILLGEIGMSDLGNGAAFRLQAEAGYVFR